MTKWSLPARFADTARISNEPLGATVVATPLVTRTPLSVIW